MTKKKQKGFTIIEIVLALAFVGVMLILYSAALNTVTLNKKLRLENYAYHIANKKMEELRAIPVTSLPASGTIVDPMLTNLPSGAGDFTVSDHVGFTGLKEMTITVTWTDGISKQIQIKSLAGTGGINP